MDKFLEMLQAYEAWLEETAAEAGIPVWLAKPLVEMEVASGACIECPSIFTCPARLYLLARDEPVDGAPKES